MSFKNLLKSKKGQAFSTFQLLIAAVVALAILAMLLPMITNGINIGTSPSKTMTDSLRNGPDEPGNLNKSEEIKFSKKDTEYINTSAIIEDTGIGSDQVKFCNKGYDSDFAIEGNGSILHVLKEQTIKYQVATLCDVSPTELAARAREYGLLDELTTTDNDEINSEDDIYDMYSNADSIACLIYPIKK